MAGGRRFGRFVTVLGLAKMLDVDLSVVFRAGQALKLWAKPYIGPQKRLTENQCNLIADYIQRNNLSARADTAADAAPTQSDIDLPADTPLNVGTMQYRPMRHPVFYPADLPEQLERHQPVVRKRLTVALQHLAAEGRTTWVKGCKGSGNEGWRRSGLDGYAHYLWWAPKGSEPVRHLDLPQDAILIGAVREHDDHRPLRVSSLEGFVPLTQPQALGEGLGEPPWEPDQIEFAQASEPVRVALGRPGAGKTSALWNAVQARDGEKVLYLTWSEDLRDVARRHLETFASRNTDFTVLTFAEFLSALANSAVHSVAVTEQIRLFRDATGTLNAGVLGPWREERGGLYAEIRAVVLGRAIPDAQSGSRRSSKSNVWHLTESAYGELCGSNPLYDGLNSKERRAVQDVFKNLDREGELARIFPEFVAVSAAAERLKRGRVPADLVHIDRIVVDEVQDLTAAEIYILLQYARHIAQVRGQGPWLLLAGDSGQTVMPTYFDWGILNGLLGEHYHKPARKNLGKNVRCPEVIARVVAEADKLYKALTKRLRPDDQLHYVEEEPETSIAGDDFGAPALYHLALPSRAAGDVLLNRIAEMEGSEAVAVIDPEVTAPDWSGSRQDDLVLSPVSVKGLEYDTVIVLDPGRLLWKVASECASEAKNPVVARGLRMAVDGLRVAVSRATQRLVFVDTTGEEEHERASLALLGTEVKPLEVDELVESLADPDLSMVERVSRRLSESRTYVDTQPRRAWVLAVQALRLLGRRDTPERITDEALVHETCEVVLRLAARFLVTRLPERITREEVLESARLALEEPAFATGSRAFDQLVNWMADTRKPPFALLGEASEYAQDSRSEWYRDAIRRIAPDLHQALERCAGDVETAAKLQDEVIEHWLRALHLNGNPEAEARRLRELAFETYLAARRLDEANQMLSSISPRDHVREARLHEASASYGAAARAYERTGRTADAVRNWRDALRWDEALRLSESDIERADLQWLIKLEELLRACPERLRSRLRAREQQHLRGMVRAVLSVELEEGPHEEDPEDPLE